MGKIHRLFRKDVYLMQMIITSECEKCIHSEIDESNRGKVKVYCRVKNKKYYWGQCIPCESKKRKHEKEEL